MAFLIGAAIGAGVFVGLCVLRGLVDGLTELTIQVLTRQP